MDENLRLLYIALADRRAQPPSEGAQSKCLDRADTAGPVSSVNEANSRDPSVEGTSRVNVKEDSPENSLSVEDFVKVITCDRVVSLIADCLLEEFDRTGS